MPLNFNHSKREKEREELGKKLVLVHLSEGFVGLGFDLILRFVGDTVLLAVLNQKKPNESVEEEKKLMHCVED